MASEIDLCNLAMSHLGHKAQITAISPPDGSVEAALCAKFYPVARDAMLEAYHWGFATKHTSLAPLGSPPSGWGYRYAYPNNSVDIQSLHAVDSDIPQEYVIEADATGRVIYTNIEDAVVKYTERVTIVNHYTPLFFTSASLMLASLLAGPIIKGKAGRSVAKSTREEALGWIGQAQTSAANGQTGQVKNPPAHTALKVQPRSIQARS